MHEPLFPHGIEILKKRALEGGGFRNTDQGDFRSDATAWAILALVTAGQDSDFINLSRSRLASCQLADGRVCISPDHPEVCWPTALSILAWMKSPAHHAALSRAAQFLFATSGVVYKPSPRAVDQHNPSLKGWPWVTGTYSWIGPTAYGVIALKAAGYGSHPRVTEAKHLILDRACLHGGWNYGNRLVYGTELRPMPENTGLALDALAGLADKSRVQPSLSYLNSRIRELRTPIALSFSLLGLGAWGERPAAAADWLKECWLLQEKIGVFDTTAIALLILASSLSGGLESLFRQRQDSPPDQGAKL